jgi:hypothetical protein
MGRVVVVLGVEDGDRRRANQLGSMLNPVATSQAALPA